MSHGSTAKIYLRANSGQDSFFLGQALGIGTTAPSDYDSEANDFVVYNANYPGITIATGSTSGRGSILFADGTTTSQKYQGGITYDHATGVSGSSVANSMYFRTAANINMTITGAGKVGIGQTVPAGKLHVDGLTSSVATILEGNGNGDQVPLWFRVKANNGNVTNHGIFGNAGSASANNTITIGPTNTSGLTVAADGTGNFSGALTAGATSLSGNLSMMSNTVYANQVYVSDRLGHLNDVSTYIDFAVDTITFAAGGERLRIASAGQIGIGGANYGTDGQVLTSTGASSAPAWEDAGGGAYSAWEVKTSAFTAASGAQLIANNATTAFTIDLPTSPSQGDTVILKNVGAALLTVGRAGEKIDGVSANATMPTGNAAQLVFTDDAAIGWTVL